MRIFHLLKVRFSKVWIKVLLERVYVLLLVVMQALVTQRLGNGNLAVDKRVPFQLL